jgi:DNA ligase-1
MERREFLQLAHTFDPDKHNVAGWFLSEKLDGMRAYWDGGLSRGLPAHEISWSNTLKDRDVKISTGLWSRLGKVIFAPDYFLDQLPDYPLDGELYLGPGQFQELVSIVKRHKPDERWWNVLFKVFDTPSDRLMFQNGRISTPHWNTEFNGIDIERDWKVRNFENAYEFLMMDENEWGPQINVVKQTQLSLLPQRVEAKLSSEMDRILNDGGEGLILRKPKSLWMPQRSHDMLKMKRYFDNEATVVGYTWAKEGKLEGLMGALVVKWKLHPGTPEVTFELSGFNDEERILHPSKQGAKKGAPGSNVGDEWFNPLFPRKVKVTFKYIDLTDKYIPKHANYLRRA